MYLLPFLMSNEQSKTNLLTIFTWLPTRWTATGTHQGQFMSVAPTGKRFTITGITIDRIVNGQIVEEWQEWDALGLMQQLGVVSALR